jgi:hypothetical protein
MAAHLLSRPLGTNVKLLVRSQLQLGKKLAAILVARRPRRAGGLTNNPQLASSDDLAGYSQYAAFNCRIPMIAGFSFQHSRPIAVPPMRVNDLDSRSVTRVGRTILSVDSLPRTRMIAPFFILAAIALFLAAAFGEIVDPLANGPADPALFGDSGATKWVAQAAPSPSILPPQRTESINSPTGSQLPAGTTAPQPLPPPVGATQAPKDPCAAVSSKPLNQLGINIAEPAGKLPTNLAAPCWDQINTQGNASASRCWTVFSYNWEASCFCHNPLYFEEVNLERYGYQCGDRSCCCSCGRECCLQPAVSAAHFFGTIPALPYCIAAECPCDCVYTLGHYRPGDCNPWRYNWPPCDPWAGLAAGGFWVGMIAAFP